MVFVQFSFIFTKTGPLEMLLFIPHLIYLLLILLLFLSPFSSWWRFLPPCSWSWAVQYFWFKNPSWLSIYVFNCWVCQGFTNFFIKFIKIVFNLLLDNLFNIDCQFKSQLLAEVEHGSPPDRMVQKSWRGWKSFSFGRVFLLATRRVFKMQYQLGFLHVPWSIFLSNFIHLLKPQQYSL